ncbi:MAG TPA: HAD hydrolase-like protein [Thermoanaerobaculia bacterium]|jgi:putative hydrolase of the HAD superfamily|nr:HAD hydrolase-like protein [Thermoanaerobaculia bacterium]
MVRETLPLFTQSVRILWTKGTPKEQTNKLERSGLRTVFDDVVVVSKKDTQALRAALRKVGGATHETLVIGNSLQHDIAPAVALGARAIWLDHPSNLRGRNAAMPDAGVVRVDGWEEIHLALIDSSHR